jgi:hypothetical protein
VGTLFSKPKLSKKEQFDKHTTNWLLDIPQKPWSAKKNIEDDDDNEDANKKVYDVFSRMK